MKIYFLITLLFSFKAYGQTKKEPLFSKEELKHPFKVKTLDISNNYWLKRLPQKIKKFKNLEDIDISANPKLDLIQSFELLSKFKKLKSLRLSRVKDSILNNVSTPKLLGMFKKLKTLWISGASDSVLKTILPHTNVEELHINENKLTTIPEVVKKLPLLRKLSLWRNEICKISLQAGDFPNLEELDLGINKLTVFPDNLSLIPKLKIVSVYSNLIGFVPSGIRKLHHLESLRMNDNKIEELPEEFGELKKLTKLDLSQNQLSSVTPLFNITSLEELNISYNKIEEISDRISIHSNLKMLDLRNNQLLSITPLFNLTSLEELRLSNNKIEEISDKIRLLKNLKDLSLSSNPIREVPEQIGKVQTLTEISINAIDSTKLPTYLSLLATLPKLETLSIEMNGIPKMPIEFQKLTQVNRFIISDCKLIRQERKRIRALFPKAFFSFYKSWTDSCFYKHKPCSMDENNWDTISVSNLNFKYLLVRQSYYYTDSDDIHHWRGDILLNIDKKIYGKEVAEKVLIAIANRLEIEEIRAVRTCETIGILISPIPLKDGDRKNYFKENYIGSYDRASGLKW